MTESLATTSADRIRAMCSKLAEFLVEKNRSYGDSALKPVGIFARGNPEDLIRVRLDDKINRIRNNPEAFGEDAVHDLAGYLILLMVARDTKSADSNTTDTHNVKGH